MTDPQPPQPAPAPQPAAPTAPVPSPAPTAQPPAPAPAQPDLGFPQGVPLEQMTDAQQAAFWKHQSRGWEGRFKALPPNLDELQRKAADYDQLRAATQTDQEKALEAARAEGRTQALRDAGKQIVDAHIAAATATILTDEQRTALLAPLDRGYFLAADGVSVDAAKISAFVAQLPAPAATPTPPGTPPAPRLDLGQGRPAPTGRPSSIELGREEARKRFNKQPANGAPAA